MTTGRLTGEPGICDHPECQEQGILRTVGSDILGKLCEEHYEDALLDYDRD